MLSKRFSLRPDLDCQLQDALTTGTRSTAARESEHNRTHLNDLRKSLDPRSALLKQRPHCCRLQRSSSLFQCQLCLIRSPVLPSLELISQSTVPEGALARPARYPLLTAHPPKANLDNQGPLHHHHHHRPHLLTSFLVCLACLSWLCLVCFFSSISLVTCLPHS